MNGSTFHNRCQFAAWPALAPWSTPAESWCPSTTFEKIESLEKKKPGTISKVFSTHPMTDDRIRDAQRNIQELLKKKPEYVVNTSEFVKVTARLAMLQNRKAPLEGGNRPRLRGSPGNGPVDDQNGSKEGTDKDERPTLQRRDN